MTNSSFSKMLQEFFLKKLINQKNASPQTVSAYRDTFRLLLNFLHGQTNKNPSDLSLKDIDGEMILKFLDHLENELLLPITKSPISTGLDVPTFCK